MKVPNKPVERMAAGGSHSQFQARCAAATAHFFRWVLLCS